MLSENSKEITSKMVLHYGVEILKDCRYYLEIIHLCNSTRTRIWKIPVPFVVMNFLCVLPMLITITRLLQFCIMSGFDLNEVSSAFAISMGSIQLTVIYISFISVRPATLETMDQMQSLVNERKTLRKEIEI